jgi:hypothetical protein
MLKYSTKFFLIHGIIHGLYLISFKQFMGLAFNLPSETLMCVFYLKN